MTKPMIRIHDTETNEIVDREMTDLEIVELEASRVIESIPELSIDEKLASVGLSITDLKTALGL
jgi:hypothetical protein